MAHVEANHLTATGPAGKHSKAKSTPGQGDVKKPQPPQPLLTGGHIPKQWLCCSQQTTAHSLHHVIKELKMITEELVQA